MRDVVLLATMLGFVALCVVYIKGCDRIIGPDEESGLEAGEATSVGRSA